MWTLIALLLPRRQRVLHASPSWNSGGLPQCRLRALRSWVVRDRWAFRPETFFVALDSESFDQGKRLFFPSFFFTILCLLFLSLSAFACCFIARARERERVRNGILSRQDARISQQRCCSPPDVNACTEGAAVVIVVTQGDAVAKEVRRHRFRRRRQWRIFFSFFFRHAPEPRHINSPPREMLFRPLQCAIHSIVSGKW